MKTSEKKNQEEIINTNKITTTNLTIKKGILSIPFATIFLISLFYTIFSMSLSLNFKAYVLNIWNNDHFIATLAFCNLVTSIIGRVFWGIILDKVSFRKLYICLILVLAFFSITLTNIGSIHWTIFLIWTSIQNFIDGGLWVIVGPGLTKVI